MSFGISIGDVFALTNLTLQAHQNWRTACGQYTEITGQLESLHIILKRVDTEAKNPVSLVNRKDGDYHDLMQIVGNCRYTVTQLNDIVVEYKNLGTLTGSRRKTWNRLKLAHTNYKELCNKLTAHTTTLSAFLDSLTTSSLGRVETRMEDLFKMTQAIDKRAEDMRKGKRESSLWSVYSNDDKEIWRAFRRELNHEGFSSDSITRHKEQLKQYIRDLSENDLLDKEPPQEHPVLEAASDDTLLEVDNVDYTSALDRDEPLAESGNHYGRLSFNELEAGKTHDFPVSREHISPPMLDSTYTTDGESSQNMPSAKPALSPGHHQQPSVIDEEAEPVSRVGVSEHQHPYSPPEQDPSLIISAMSDTDSVPKDAPKIIPMAKHDTPPRQPFAKARRERRKSFPNMFTDSGQTSGSQSLREAEESSSKFVPKATNDNSRESSGKQRRNHDQSPPRPLYETEKSTENSAPEWSKSKLLKWPPFAVSDLHPVKELPMLLEGWDFRIGPHNELFYLDAYAGIGAKKCFWLPPSEELYPDEPTPHGWEKVVTAFGRIHWRDEIYGLVSYEHPCRTPAILWDGEVKWSVDSHHQANQDYKFQPWNEVGDDSLVQLCDENVACQITAEVWHNGLSEKAITERGDLWWREYDTKGKFNVAEHLFVENPFWWRGSAVKRLEDYRRMKKQS